MKAPNLESMQKKPKSNHRLKMKNAWLVTWIDLSDHRKSHNTIIGLFAGRTSERFIRDFVRANYLRCTGGLQDFMEAANGFSSSKDIVKKAIGTWTFSWSKSSPSNSKL